jgi:hypothetical protein
MLSSWRMYEMHLALFLKAGCYTVGQRVGATGRLASFDAARLAKFIEQGVDAARLAKASSEG